jgi:hypothetical protein
MLACVCWVLISWKHLLASLVHQFFCCVSGVSISEMMPCLNTPSPAALAKALLFVGLCSYSRQHPGGTSSAPSWIAALNPAPDQHWLFFSLPQGTLSAQDSNSFETVVL